MAPPSSSGLQLQDWTHHHDQVLRRHGHLLRLHLLVPLEGWSFGEAGLWGGRGRSIGWTSWTLLLVLVEVLAVVLMVGVEVVGVLEVSQKEQPAAIPRGGGVWG